MKEEGRSSCRRAGVQLSQGWSTGLEYRAGVQLWGSIYAGGVYATVAGLEYSWWGDTGELVGRETTAAGTRGGIEEGLGLGLG